MRDISKYINNLSPEERRVLLAQLLRKKANESNFIPLSFAQQRIWFLDQLQQNSAFYNISLAWHLSGQLNIVALESSINEIIQRHEALRTNFAIVGDQPVQVIASTLSFQLQVVNLWHLSENQREIEAKRLATIEANRPFNLEQEPLLRGEVLQLGETEYLLLLTMHHIIWDGWSLGVFVRELTELYKGFCTGKPPILPELPVQYADFALWQRQWLTGEILETQLHYWKEQLKNAPNLLELPTDRARSAVQTFRGRCYYAAFSKELSAELVTLGKRAGVTLFITLFAAFQTLLYRLSGQDDIVVGTPVAGRNRREIEGLIGFFVNTLVLRTHLGGNPSFEQLLKRVWEVALQGYTHQDLPFEQLVEALQPTRNLSYTPLFQVMFALDDGGVHSIELLDLAVSSYSMEIITAKFDLTLSMENTADGLVGEWEYNSALFDETTIVRMAEHFQTLLEGIVANSKQAISELPLLTPRGRQQLLVEWNNTAKDYPQEKCIHQLFEEQVERTPNAVAVVLEEKQLTYRELNAKANQLANYLRSLGVGPEVLVGICVERSREMIIGLLGILKAGGAYVPLDPNYPFERLAFMLEDSSVPVLLTQERLVEKLPQHSACVVCLDSEWGKIAVHSKENPSIPVKPKNLAYVIYTSGSTGKPKGVLIQHESLVNYTTVASAEYEIDQYDRILQFSSISFDVSAEEIYTSLTSGATLVLRTDSMLDSVEGFLQKCKKWEITVMAWPTAYWHELTAFLTQETVLLPPSLRLIIIGGEKALPDRLKIWIEYAGERVRLLNNYGPTEATVGATICDLSVADTTLKELPIGRPLGNVQTYILDGNRQPVPIGIPGELHIGGAGLARGYLNRPDLTDERFIRNPFSDFSTSRLYKTGDLARYLNDGNIEYLGRIDNQVKVRGFRIELGEIEAALSQHPNLLQVAVTLREDISGQKSLVAYIVPLQEPAATFSELRHFLKEQLPDYMVPSAFVTLKSLPLTPNGKVDRRTLPSPELPPELELTFVAPCTPIEEMLANIWACVLGIEQVGVHHNFFELGGHSLLAAQIISRVRDTMSVELPLRSLFEAPTVATLAERIENLLHSGQSIQAQPLLPIPRSGDIPLSFAQARLWFLDQLQPNSAFYNIPSALRLSGQLNIAALESSLNEIICRHEVLRTNFTKVSGQPIQVIASTLKLKLLKVDLQNLPFCEREVEAQRLATTEAQRPFDLEREPLVRAKLLQLDETEYVFLLTVHHIIFDGWSTGVFYGELATLYEAKCTGKPKVLPELPVQYADFAVWQRYWLTPELLETQLNYGKQQLLGAPALLELPTDRPRKAVQSYRGAYHSFGLSLELSQALANLSRQAGVTLFMTLYAAFVTLLYRYTGSSDIVVGTPVAGRNRQEIEGLIGFFVNTLALRTDFSANASFEQLLRQVREVALQAYAHQDLPFEQLVEALQPERSLSYTPLFQVMFALDEKSVPSMELPDLTFSSFSFETGTTKFDLTLSMENTASGLIGGWEYNSDLFDAATIARYSEHFLSLLEGIVANPIQPISELPLLTEAERQQLLVEWNNTFAEFPQDKCIHQLFEEQLERSPDAIAVVFEGEQLTYRELNTRANQLAHYLRTLGVGPEVLVGICVERSFDMIVGLLGILKAGGAYVPIDHAYPTDRIAYMLDDSQLPVLLTQKQLVASLPEHQARVVCLDSDWEEISLMPELPPQSDVTPENLVYVIYTSGSTGKPKGVLIAHRGLCNLAQAQIKLFDVQPDSRVLQLATFSFDASISEIVMALCSGARLCLGTRDSLQPGLPLLRLLQEQGITHLTLVPSALAALPSEELAALQNIIVAGEPCPTSLVAQWAGGRRFFNAYGPTESTVCATVAQGFEGMDVLPIGRPIDNTQVYILDHHKQPVPIGVSGELYIASVGLAKGYLNRPDLTAKKFIPNPFSDALGLSLYKTGDLARYLPDGNIEYLGRIDNQVKIRGFRIELGEIEAVLTQHPGVRETAVIARVNSADDNQLVAYIVPHQEPAHTVSDLRHFLKEQLPDYMVPRAFVMLCALPLTPNGKVDRKSLPAPDLNSLLQKSDFVAPRTPTEKLVASIWAKVLGVEQVGINDNFFELGGHSLLATQLLSQVSDTCGVELPLSQLFKDPTVASISNYIEAISWASHSLKSSNNTVNNREEVEF
jgi:amino acid adenylation domain-containing protein